MEFSHFRDKEQKEVDIVMEDRRGRVVGIEVKASATVNTRDFAGIRRLSEACGDRFVLGLVLHDHEHSRTLRRTPARRADLGAVVVTAKQHASPGR